MLCGSLIPETVACTSRSFASLTVVRPSLSTRSNGGSRATVCYANCFKGNTSLSENPSVRHRHVSRGCGVSALRRSVDSILRHNRFYVSISVEKDHITSCWNCKAVRSLTSVDNFFCNSCKMIQPPLVDLNYFELLDLPSDDYSIDLKLVQNTYRELQSLLHPDKFGQKTKEEKEYSEAQSSLLNKAFGTLTDPVRRASYLLELNGCPLEEQETALLEADFLGEMLELNELVSESTDLDGVVAPTGARAALQLQECQQAFSDALKEGDFDAARRALARMKCHARVKDNADRRFGMHKL